MGKDRRTPLLRKLTEEPVFLYGKGGLPLLPSPRPVGLFGAYADRSQENVACPREIAWSHGKLVLGGVHSVCRTTHVRPGPSPNFNLILSQKDRVEAIRFQRKSVLCLVDENSLTFQSSLTFHPSIFSSSSPRISIPVSTHCRDRSVRSYHAHPDRFPQNFNLCLSSPS